MEHPNCDAPGCEGKVEVRLTWPTLLEGLTEECYCAKHATEALSKATRNFTEDLRTVASTRDRCAVEVELVVCDARDGCASQVVLREIAGARRLSFPTGRFEAWTLAWELRREATMRLGTHRAMVAVIRALGGDLESVAINDMSPPDTFHAQVYMSKGGPQVVVGMRPSDAIILATICTVPINVEAAVWAGRA